MVPTEVGTSDQLIIHTTALDVQVGGSQIMRKPIFKRAEKLDRISDGTVFCRARLSMKATTETFVGNSAE